MNNLNSEAEGFLNLLASDQILGYDVETNGLNWKTGFVCGYGISDGYHSFYVPVRHDGGGNIANVEDFEKLSSNIIKNRTKPLVGHNIKFDMHFSENHGIKLGNKVIDTMVRAALINENRRSFTLQNVCKEFPDIQQKKGKELYEHIASIFNVEPTSNSMGMYYKLPGNDVVAVDYAKMDNVAVKQLYDAQSKELYVQELEVVNNLEANLTYVIQKMERKGIRVDLDQLEVLKNEVHQLRLEAYAQIPLQENLIPININSSKDLQTYFEYCNIEDWPLTEKGNPSFNALYLKTHTEGELILQARKLDTFQNMFLTPINNHIYNGRVHTRFNQAIGEFGGAKPGRLSSADPNMQQIPKRDETIGRKFRQIFLADEDFYLIEFDYSQAEPRLFTHYSKEPILIKGYNSIPYVDMHSIAAELMGLNNKYGYDTEGLEKARNISKNLNLGIMYTMGAEKLANQLGISYSEAKSMISYYYKQFPNISSFTRAASNRAEARGYVKTILGRRARFPYGYYYRAANRIVQGGSADILKKAMVRINNWIEQNGYDDVCQMLLTTHDSLLIQFHKDYLYIIDDIVRIMEDVNTAPFNLIVPFKVNYKSAANNWGDATYGIKKAA